MVLNLLRLLSTNNFCQQYSSNTSIRVKWQLVTSHATNIFAQKENRSIEK